MNWTNYHHLLYFYTSVKLGGVGKAALELHVSQPTVSKLIHSLEMEVGEKLWVKSGRGHKLTEVGEVVFQYAEKIFSLGNEMRETLKKGTYNKEQSLVIGLNQALPKLIAVRLITPLNKKFGSVKLKCVEGPLDDLLESLYEHKIDVVLSDSPTRDSKHQAFNHLIMESKIALYGSSKFQAESNESVSKLISRLPLILPSYPSALRQAFDEWCFSHKINPTIVAECDDSGLMKALGAEGVGVFIAPVIVEKEISTRLKVKQLVMIPGIKEKVWLINSSRKIINPIVQELIPS